ncbi:MAG: winged helix-turn-helix domain-containing protein [Actinomycetota bacterium]|nr:winged helix-turn-helix domain-containing protein [Actinomycetota bacterium]
MLARSPSTPPPPPNIRRVGSIEIRPEELQVIVDGKRVGLTVREFEIFFVLAERFDRVIPREEIYQLVWGARMPRRDRSVDVFVRKVRGKLDSAGPGWTYIHTHFGIGYRFAPERDAQPDNNGSRPLGVSDETGRRRHR